jgi:excisionase family DNA binding protein
MSRNTTATPANRRARRHPEDALPARRWATPTEAADYARVTTRTIRQMAADGRITLYRNGSRLVRVDLNELDASMQPYGGAAS